MLVRLAPCGVCHSDLNTAERDWPHWGIAVQIARELGAEAIAVDMFEEQLELANSLGANVRVNAASTDAGQYLGKQGA